MKAKHTCSEFHFWEAREGCRDRGGWFCKECDIEYDKKVHGETTHRWGDPDVFWIKGAEPWGS